MGVHIGGAWGMATALTALLQGPFMGPQAGRARLEGGVGPVGEGLDLAPVRNNLLELESTRAVGRRVLDVGAATSGELRAEPQRCCSARQPCMPGSMPQWSPGRSACG